MATILAFCRLSPKRQGDEADWEKDDTNENDKAGIARPVCIFTATRTGDFHVLSFQGFGGFGSTVKADSSVGFTGLESLSAD